MLPTDGLWRGAIYNLEPVGLVLASREIGRAATANPFFVDGSAPTAYIVWAIVWVAGMLSLAIWSFGRREV